MSQSGYCYGNGFVVWIAINCGAADVSGYCVAAWGRTVTWYCGIGADNAIKTIELILAQKPLCAFGGC